VELWLREIEVDVSRLAFLQHKGISENYHLALSFGTFFAIILLDRFRGTGYTLEMVLHCFFGEFRKQLITYHCKFVNTSCW
jgi:hypothetical protein